MRRQIHILVKILSGCDAIGRRACLRSKILEVQVLSSAPNIKGEMLCRQKKHYKKHTAVFQKKLVSMLTGVFQHGEVLNITGIKLPEKLQDKFYSEVAQR